MSRNADTPQQQGVLRMEREGADAGWEGEGRGGQLGGLETQAFGVEETELYSGTAHDAYDAAAGA